MEPSSFVASLKLAQQLRDLADKIETIELHRAPPFEFPYLRADFRAHGVTTREDLAQFVRLMQCPDAHQSKGIHWVTGSFSDRIRVTAHYQPGLLSKTRTTRVIERVHELKPDLAGLLAAH